MTDVRTQKEKIDDLDTEAVQFFLNWLKELRLCNKPKMDAAAVAALTDIGGKQHHVALILLGAQQQLEALIKEIERDSREDIPPLPGK